VLIRTMASLCPVLCAQCSQQTPLSEIEMKASKNDLLFSYSAFELRKALLTFEFHRHIKFSAIGATATYLILITRDATVYCYLILLAKTVYRVITAQNINETQSPEYDSHTR